MAIRTQLQDSHSSGCCFRPEEREKLEEEVLELFSKGRDVQLYPKAVQGKVLVDKVKREWCLIY